MSWKWLRNSYGNDVIKPGDGQDYVNAGDGNDDVETTNDGAADSIDGGAGSDVIWGAKDNSDTIDHFETDNRV